MRGKEGGGVVIKVNSGSSGGGLDFVESKVKWVVVRQVVGKKGGCKERRRYTLKDGYFVKQTFGCTV